MALAFRTLLRRASPAGTAARLSVLIYHRVLAEPDPLNSGEPTGAEFETRLRWIKAQFHVMPLHEAIAGLRNGSLPERALAITFDDGYADNFDVALPILTRLGLHATFFVATGFLDGGRMFNDTVVEAVRRFRGDELDLTSLGLDRYPTGSLQARVTAIRSILHRVKYLPLEARSEIADGIARRVGAALPTDLMMTSKQVAAAAVAGIEIGAHTVRHPILARLDRAAARREIEDSRRHLERITGKPVRLFAYPNGRPGTDYTDETVALVRELGFFGAVTTSPGSAGVGDDPYQVPRFTPWARDTIRFGLQLWRNAGQAPTVVPCPC